jgi:hypothetical protein
MLAYVVYHYAWTRSRVFTGALGPFLYFGMPATVSALLLASIKLPPVARVRLSTVLSSTSIAVYGFGIVVTLWSQMPSVRERRDLRWARFSISESGGDKLRRAVLRAVRDAGVPLVDVTEAFSARRDAVSLFSLRIGYHYNEEGARVVAETVLRAIDVVNC